MQSKKQCRRSAFFRHFTEPLQECNGIFQSRHLLMLHALSDLIYLYSWCYRDVWYLCILKRGERNGCLWFVALTCSSIYTFYSSFTIYFVLKWMISFVFFLPFNLWTFSYFITTILFTQPWGYFTDHAKLMVSLLQDMQVNDQRSTMLQLVDKMKIKQKKQGWFFSLLFLYLIFSWLDCLLWSTKTFGHDQSSPMVLSYP